MLKMCGPAEDTRSFACGLLVSLSAFTVNAHHRLKHKKCPLGLKRVQSIQKTKSTKLGFFFFYCTLKGRMRYKFPYCYPIWLWVPYQSIMLIYKGPWNFLLRTICKEEMANNLNRLPFCYMNCWMLFLTLHWGNKEFKRGHIRSGFLLQ